MGLEGHVKRIEIGWDDTKLKAAERLKLLNNTKAAWEAYALGLENIAVEFDKAEEEIKKVKKRFNLQAANDDLALRQKIYNDTHKVITGMHDQLNENFNIMTMTLPEDKKDFVKKEIGAVTEKLSVLNRFDERVKKIRDFVEALTHLDKSLKELDTWMKGAELLPQGDSVPKDAQDYKDELMRIKKYVDDL